AIRIDPTTAIGIERLGFFASPARLTGLWKPLKANTTPEVATAVSTPDQPWGAKPPWSVKFSAWKPAAINPATVRRGTASLNTVMALFAAANRRTVQKFSRK